MMKRMVNYYKDDLQTAIAASENEDYATALRKLEPLARKKDPVAQFKLGNLYEGGCGVEQDREYAIALYTLSAEQGYVIAQAAMGMTHDELLDVPDYKTAVKWYTLAAEQGHLDSQYALGLMYQKGEGVSKNNIHAYKWYTLVISSGEEVGWNDSLERKNKIELIMSDADISAAQDLVREFVPKQ